MSGGGGGGGGICPRTSLIMSLEVIYDAIMMMFT